MIVVENRLQNKVDHPSHGTHIHINAHTHIPRRCFKVVAFICKLRLPFILSDVGMEAWERSDGRVSKAGGREEAKVPNSINESGSVIGHRPQSPVNVMSKEAAALRHEGCLAILKQLWGPWLTLASP